VGYRFLVAATAAVALTLLFSGSVAAENRRSTGLGIDIDFYTGPIPDDSWQQMREAGQQFAIVQAWGGRSRNEFAVSQLSGARSIGMKTAAYVLLNYDDKVCSTFAHPVRDNNGKCEGDPIPQPKSGGRWQVQQGLAALGSQRAQVAFVAIDVEWFLAAPPSTDASARGRHRQYILDAIDEVRKSGKRPVIYTRNGQGHWLDITGCAATSSEGGCVALYKNINDPSKPVPLWDVQDGAPDLGNFQPHSGWTERAGRQYKLDQNFFGLPSDRTIDLNVFDLSLFSQETRDAVRTLHSSGRPRHRAPKSKRLS